LPTTRRRVLRVAVASTALIFMGSAHGARALEQSAGHHYDVPRAYLIPDSTRPFFLPPSRGGFAFNLNPEAALPDQVIVGVESKATVCARARGSPADVNVTVCGQAKASWRGRPLKRKGDEIFWIYADDALDRATVIVRCFAATGGGLCMTTIPWGENVLSIHLRDADVGSLPRLVDQSTKLLARWER